MKKMLMLAALLGFGLSTIAHADPIVAADNHAVVAEHTMTEKAEHAEKHAKHMVKHDVKKVKKSLHKAHKAEKKDMKKIEKKIDAKEDKL